MSVKYQDWLAANIIAEETTVTYRSLSRALKVHANAAKQMLYDFHQTQNARKPSSVHATYLLSGVRKPAAPAANGINGSRRDEGEQDTPMADVSFSGLMSSSMPEHDDESVETVSITTITLAAEANLANVKTQYESISSIHIYSLSPGPLSDLHVLADCNRRLATDYASEDPLETWKIYGTIHNPKAQRRAPRVPLSAPVAAANVTAGMKPAAASSSKKVSAAAAAQSKNTTGSSTTSAGPASQSTSTTARKPPTTKRESSNLMESFGKTAASNAKLKLNTPADGADEADDDAMEEDQPLDAQETAEQRARAEAARKDKAATDAKLRAMMEGHDDEDNPVDDGDDEMKEAWSESEPEPEPEPEPEAQAPAAPTQAEQGVTTVGGRRRGRRRVMKKKTTKDAEGYLVTKEEAGWESFSEDDAPAAKPRDESAAKKAKLEAPAATVAAAATAKKGTGAVAKKGQGNIMSFFKK